MESPMAPEYARAAIKDLPARERDRLLARLDNEGLTDDLRNAIADALDREANRLDRSASLLEVRANLRERLANWLKRFAR